MKKDYLATLYKVIENSDIVVEVLDARFFEETRNHLAEEKIKELGKRIIYVLNKIDLVDMKELKKKTGHLFPRVFISAISKRGARDLKERMMMEAKKLPYQKAFIGIIGYPNTGKSSLINLLAGRGVAKASPQSGFTKGMQKIRLSATLTLIDTPGVIPEYEYSSQPEGKDLVKHAKLGVRMHDRVKDPLLIVDALLKTYPGVLEKHYGLVGESLEIVEDFAKKRNYYLKGGKLDIDRAAREMIKDWQRGKIKTL